jgi:hypothetical protein
VTISGVNFAEEFTFICLLELVGGYGDTVIKTQDAIKNSITPQA